MTSPTILKAIYAIRHKPSGNFISCNSHCAWSKAGSAKISWALKFVGYKDRKGAFDRQDVYEVVNLLDTIKQQDDKILELLATHGITFIEENK